jgi:anti-sigma B factor antagonist
MISERASATSVAAAASDPTPSEMTIAAGASGPTSLEVSGEVDASNADRLRLAILDAATERGPEIEVDLAGVTFMDSTGVRSVADASRALETLGTGLVLCHVPRQVGRLFEITDDGRSLKVRR